MRAHLSKLSRKIPLARKLIERIEAARRDARSRREFSRLRATQTIVREGSPACFSDMPLEVHWVLTNACNYRCSYCFQQKRGYTDDSCSMEQLKTAVEHIASSNRPSYQISLLGGEPTMFPHLAELIDLLDQRLGERIEVLRILTNGSFLEKQLYMIVKAARHMRIVVTISVHFEFVRNESILELIRSYSDVLDFELLIMFQPDCFDDISSMVEELISMRADYPFHMSIDTIREPPDFKHLLKSYTEEHDAWIRDASSRFDAAAKNSSRKGFDKVEETGWTFEFEKKGYLGLEREVDLDTRALKDGTACDFSGMYCTFGASVLDIDPSGVARGAICSLAPLSCNIFEVNPFEHDDWIRSVPCTKALCGCNLNYRIPKFLSREEAERFSVEKAHEQVQLTQSSDEAQQGVRA